MPTTIKGLVVAVVALAGATFVACDVDGPIEPSPQCTYTLSPATRTFASDGGADVATVATGADCAWSTVTASWITITSGAAGTGPGTVAYTVAENLNQTSRVGKLSIGKSSITIIQDGRGPCTYDVSPQSGTFPPEGGAGTIHITAPAPCDWTVSTASSWLAVVSGAAGRGTGDVSFTVAQYTGEADRTGVLTAAGALVTILQLAPPVTPPPPPPPPADCTYSVAPVEFQLHWHHTGGNVTMTTGANCTWTVSREADWLTLQTAGEGSGSGVIRFATTAYIAEAPRRAPVQVRWPTPTAGQNVWVTQEGCRYAIGAVGPATFSAAGGSGTATVFGDPVSTSCPIGCPWTAVPDADWIHIVSSMPRAGDDQITYRVDVNTTGQDRIGRIRVETGILTVGQLR